MFHQVFICDEPQEASPPNELVLADILKHDPGGDTGGGDMFSLKMETEDIKLGPDHVSVKHDQEVNVSVDHNQEVNVSVDHNQEVKFEIKKEPMDEDPLVILPDADIPGEPEACRKKLVWKENEGYKSTNAGKKLKTSTKGKLDAPSTDMKDVLKADKIMQFKETTVNIYMHNPDVPFITPDVDYKTGNTSSMPLYIVKKEDDNAEYEISSTFGTEEKMEKLKKSMKFPSTNKIPRPNSAKRSLSDDTKQNYTKKSRKRVKNLNQDLKLKQNPQKMSSSNKIYEISDDSCSDWEEEYLSSRVDLKREHKSSNGDGISNKKQCTKYMNKNSEIIQEIKAEGQHESKSVLGTQENLLKLNINTVISNLIKEKTTKTNSISCPSSTSGKRDIDSQCEIKLTFNNKEKLETLKNIKKGVEVGTDDVVIVSPLCLKEIEDKK